ncbi:MAG: hypothetical protein H7175_07295 [Burkholderiales bacterium]|nr:hypothetical protein [Anaerolineae bacterium]
MESVAVRRLRNIHWLLAVQSLVVILVSINRLSSLTLTYVTANEFLRWVDLLNMLVLPIMSLVAFYLLKKVIEQPSAQVNQRAHIALNLMFIVGVYVLGASYGDHEVTNYLHSRFCIVEDAADGSATGFADMDSDLCRIVIFNDDEFSHWLFFTGFVMVNGALLLLQAVFPHGALLSQRDIALLIVNGLFIGAGIFANLAFEVIGLDLVVIVLLAVMSVLLLWRRGREPLFVYYAMSYVFGLVATAIVKLLVGTT